VSSFLKALAIVGAILMVLLIAAGIAGYYWWSNHGRKVVESGRQARAEGQQFGEESDDQGCLDEAVALQKLAGGLAQTISHSLFLGGCVWARAPTDGFCDQVPKRKDMAKSGVWQARRCTEAGFGDPYCRQLFVQVQEYCESGLARLPGAGARTSPRGRD
jgi:hypothetical protein